MTAPIPLARVDLTVGCSATFVASYEHGAKLTPCPLRMAIGAAWIKSKLNNRQMTFRDAVQPVMNVHLSAPHCEVLPFGAVRFAIEGRLVCAVGTCLFADHLAHLLEGLDDSYVHLRFDPVTGVTLCFTEVDLANRFAVRKCHVTMEHVVAAIAIAELESALLA